MKDEIFKSQLEQNDLLIKNEKQKKEKAQSIIQNRHMLTQKLKKVNEEKVKENQDFRREHRQKLENAERALQREAEETKQDTARQHASYAETIASREPFVNRPVECPWRLLCERDSRQTKADLAAKRQRDRETNANNKLKNLQAARDKRRRIALL